MEREISTKTCPACGSTQITEENGTYRCANPACGETRDDEDRELAGLSDDYIAGLSMYNDEDDL